MKITLVTCSGPDDGNDPVEIARLGAAQDGEAVPEIGIEASATRAGTPEYPSLAWIEAYAEAAARLAPAPRSALHVNGRWSRQAAAGEPVAEVLALLRRTRADGRPVFGRLQLNFDAGRDGIEAAGLLRLAAALPTLRLVLQSNPANAGLLPALAARGLAFDAVFDASLGLGVVPDAWPEAVPGRSQAYAGGLGPEALATHMPAIARAARAVAAIGVDAQSRLRSPDRERFLPERARAFVAAAGRWNASRTGETGGKP